MSLKINEQIMALRKQKGITQGELADVLGVSNQSVSKWESGQCCPDIQLLPTLAAYFEVSIDELMGVDVLKTEPRSDIEEENDTNINDTLLGDAVELLGKMHMSGSTKLLGNVSSRMRKSVPSWRTACFRMCLSSITNIVSKVRICRSYPFCPYYAINKRLGTAVPSLLLYFVGQLFGGFQFLECLKDSSNWNNINAVYLQFSHFHIAQRNDGASKAEARCLFDALFQIAHCAAFTRKTKLTDGDCCVGNDFIGQ